MGLIGIDKMQIIDIWSQKFGFGTNKLVKIVTRQIRGFDRWQIQRHKITSFGD